ncbi:MAG: LLM class flavin-dependent oxidoreductase, partial [Rhodospirillaceae bacterium]|nr:LLM class flavin-dependent oxidoreductase [Rhodospirillaceae bacterium]
MIQLSVLDLAYIGEGFSPADALTNALDLAQHAEAAGFTRFWLAEHHN